MNFQRQVYRTTRLALAALISLTLFACGSDGEDGKDGEDGVVGVNIDSTATLKVNFTDARVEDGKVTADFMLTNANGVAVLGLTKTHDLRLGIAQLTQVTQTIGAGDDAREADLGYQWQAYINSLRQPGTVPEGVDGLTPSPQYQAGVEAANGCDTCLVDHGDGSYSYSFQVNIAQVTEPLAVVYNADATQRITMELRLPQVVANGHFDWQPSTGNTEGIQTRNVVTINACYTCHQPDSLKLHGGRRIDIENCVACHTATSGDPESGNSVEFTYLIHAIHRGAERHTFDADGNQVDAPYKIVGFGGSVHDYGLVHFPRKPASDCSVCHQEGQGAPADAALFKAEKSNTACVACHSEKPSAHHASTDCMACHNTDNTYHGTGSPTKRHGDVMKAYTLAGELSVKVLDVSANAGKMTFKVQVLDKNGAPMDQTFIDQGSRMVVAWDVDKDYPAYNDASYSNRRIRLREGTYDATEKSYTLTPNAALPAMPDGKSFEIWSTLEACFNNGGYGVDDIQLTDCSTDGVRTVAIKESPYRFVWGNNGIDSSQQAAMRRAIIDTAKCQACHGQEIHHYDNGVNCQTCHTSDKTLSNSSTYPGGRIPTSFAWKAHEREGHFLKYGGLQSGTVLKTDCATCHTEAGNNVTGITLGRAPDRVWRYGDTQNNGADIWVSSDAGSCLSCHQQYLSDAAKSHITANGGILDGMSEADVRNRAKEACSTCHTPTQLMEVHGN
ncbi:OmcA/MtrC family decaheme c-type cytochrome [Shewanella sp. FJAT-52076]|uniref:OmcA/MtrC family decaheme c-type cytochrome n=1 Tax=Shewanella sp. FJAT-52076 TaxID=2864202 RepID=UPI001C65F8DA|nr:OmcA/MtrC family decaheme c-type cytochrome [Shewanella sp. FJAT-52076]QYJ76554.1 OmcA/MtrC family decaheme c-type cytochrome [Shewanella sp. FJAT-52076]